MECYAEKTATFLILGDVCTRGCRFCSVKKGHPLPPDPDEPRRVAEAAPDSDSSTWSSPASPATTCPTAVRSISVGPMTRSSARQGDRRVLFQTIEVLPSDFAGNVAAVDRLVDAAPEVYNHNTETVPRLFPAVRGKRRQAPCRNGPIVLAKRFLTPFSPTTPGRWKCSAASRRANPADRPEDGPDARTGRNAPKNCSIRWPICSRPAVAA